MMASNASKLIETSEDMCRPQRALIGIFIQHPDNEISIIEEISLYIKDLSLLVIVM